MKDNQTVGRARLQAFFDSETFVELGAFVSRPGTADAEGVICGYGAVAGRLVFAFAQDAGLMKGALDIGHADKIVAVYQKAMAVGAPVVGFFDCAGAVVFDGANALAGYGKLLSAAAGASGVIPQIAVIDGVCAGTMAAMAALFDVVVTVKGESRLYVTSPTLLEGEGGTAEYAAENGNAALLAGSKEEAADLVRDLLSYLPDAAGGNAPVVETDDLNRALTNKSFASAFEALEASVDAGQFMELFASVAGNTRVGFCGMGGMSAVAIAVEGRIGVADVEKMTRAVSLANDFTLPTVVFVNCEGMEASVEGEAYMPAALARLTKLLVAAKAPRVTAIVGKAIGAGFLFPGACTLGADVVFALPDAEIAALTASAGVAFLWNDRIGNGVTREALEAEWRRDVSAPEVAASMGQVDDIVSPDQLRARILAAILMLRGKRA